MRLLLLGGYRFLGRAVIDSARRRGHAVTVFNRGSTRTADLGDVEWILGDRSHDLERLRARSWDAVIDTCGYLPADVASSAASLRDATAQYTFVSSISTYALPIATGLDETAAVCEMPPGADPSKVANETYGALKVLCERALEVLNVRAGAIVGPYDYFDRFASWLERAARGGTMLAPGRPQRLVQLIDVNDLADWMVSSSERKLVGTVNASGPTTPITMRDLIEACGTAKGSTASIVWVDDDYLQRAGVLEDEELPFWERDEANGLFELDLGRARRMGLVTRPLVETAIETYAWTRQCVGTDRKRGLDPANEANMLARYRVDGE